ncbi:hypothetical protein PAHA111176_02150 [Parendozoicomonas haliclonae]|uniref:Uncharacterized protein n=1 Tax=Parendozoicomonas haliclonae TaxID=1960125 RepID=A0A1X7ARN5_9GAMM|nr:hypothetical protein EHSB41UT_04797 [Parendozoicomonas haliclonae]
MNDDVDAGEARTLSGTIYPTEKNLFAINVYASSH